MDFTKFLAAVFLLFTLVVAVITSKLFVVDSIGFIIDYIRSREKPKERDLRVWLFGTIFGLLLTGVTYWIYRYFIGGC